MQSIRQTVLLEVTEPSSPTASASFFEGEPRRFPTSYPKDGVSQAASLKPSAAEEWDVKAAAIVIGLTVFFVTFLFGLVTEIVSGLIPLGILSGTCAGSLSLLARGWMLSRLREQASTPKESGE
jgi:hypothetical protein